MNILQKIIIQKQYEIMQRTMLYPVKLLERSSYYTSPIVSMKTYIMREDKSGVIAEIKRGSPSKGIINKYVSVEKTSINYMQAGASALSVLTDEQFFMGSNQDLMTARQYNFCPILRKDFIIDEYQIIEARSIGADAILLIAAILNVEGVKRLACFARSLGLEVILEVHSKKDLDAINEYIDIVGINNRNLQTFETDTNTSFSLYPLIPKGFVTISESGIHSPNVAFQLKQTGFNGFLIGEQFMSHSQPGLACANFIQQLNQLHATEDMRLK